MDDREAIEILKKMMDRGSLKENEREAIRTAIGMLSWSKLIEPRMKSIKKSREKRMSEE
jgi:hypothetical protein